MGVLKLNIHVFYQSVIFSTMTSLDTEIHQFILFPFSVTPLTQIGPFLSFLRTPFTSHIFQPFSLCRFHGTIFKSILQGTNSFVICIKMLFDLSIFFNFNILKFAWLFEIFLKSSWMFSHPLVPSTFLIHFIHFNVWNTPHFHSIVSNSTMHSLRGSEPPVCCFCWLLLQWWLASSSHWLLISDPREVHLCESTLI